jgi:hypothetical protein
VLLMATLTYHVRHRVMAPTFLVILALAIPASAIGLSSDLEREAKRADRLRHISEVAPECLMGRRSPGYDPRVCGELKLAAPPECLLGWLWPGYDPAICVEPVK